MTNEVPKLKITNETGDLYDTKISIDGVDLSEHISSLSLELDVTNRTPRATITFYAFALEVDSNLRKVLAELKLASPIMEFFDDDVERLRKIKEKI